MSNVIGEFYSGIPEFLVILYCIEQGHIAIFLGFVILLLDF